MGKMGKNVLADRIRYAMVKRRYMQNELAAAAHVHATLLSLWINGHSTPRLDGIKKLADALNVTPQWLCGWEPLECMEPLKNDSDDWKTERVRGIMNRMNEAGRQLVYMNALAAEKSELFVSR